jgi:hypothetical protein
VSTWDNIYSPHKSPNQKAAAAAEAAQKAVADAAQKAVADAAQKAAAAQKAVADAAKRDAEAKTAAKLEAARKRDALAAEDFNRKATWTNESKVVEHHQRKGFSFFLFLFFLLLTHVCSACMFVLHKAALKRIRAAAGAGMMTSGSLGSWKSDNSWDTWRGVQVRSDGGLEVALSVRDIQLSECSLADVVCIFGSRLVSLNIDGQKSMQGRLTALAILFLVLFPPVTLFDFSRRHWRSHRMPQSGFGFLRRLQSPDWY